MQTYHMKINNSSQSLYFYLFLHNIHEAQTIRISFIQRVEFDILLLSFWPEGRHKTAAHQQTDNIRRRRRSAEQKGEDEAEAGAEAEGMQSVNENMTPERNFYDTLKSKVFVYYTKEGDGRRGG